MESRASIKHADSGADTPESLVGHLTRGVIESRARYTMTSNDEHTVLTIQPGAVVIDLEVDGIHYWAIRHRDVAESSSPAGSAPRADGVTDAGCPSAALSPREYEIARMVAKGYANKTIASVLDISTWTVSSHLRRIYSKFGVTTRAAMVARLFDDSPHRLVR